MSRRAAVAAVKAPVAKSSRARRSADEAPRSSSAAWLVCQSRRLGTKPYSSTSN